ncbi:MAG: cytochrome c [Betaproteobacteria bacterium]|nr:cytochrome c [Betaproteobacteria bacterium]MDE2622875.1 cytochrome c [Betaproteobacteria bacterium]
MRKSNALMAIAGTVLLASLAYALMGMGGGMGPGMMGHGPAGVSVVRHRYVMSHGIDSAYANASNPLYANDANLKAGKAVFEKNCAICHGVAGHGAGPAAKGLNPAASDLTSAMRMPMVSDSYLDWTISEGGVPVQSAMPPFKSVLTKDELWELVLYLRTL